MGFTFRPRRQSLDLRHHCLKFLAAVCLSLLGSLARPAATQAAPSNFTNSLHTTYTINPDGTTGIQHQITITNNSPTYYVRQYAIKVTSAKGIERVRVTSNGQPLAPNVVKTDNQTSIGITFPDKILGEGKQRDLVISYQNNDAAVISGRVLEIHIPRLSDDTIYQNYGVTLLTPARFGQPIRTSPEPSGGETGGEFVVTNFDQAAKEGVSALFGSDQVFNVTLRYSLENPTSNPGLAQIALPPDTQYQKMSYTNLDPLPETIETDADGNWIATYQVPANNTTTVYLTAQAQIFLDPQVQIPPSAISPALTQPKQYWESDNADIQKLAADFPTVKDLYLYVVKTLTYYTPPTTEAPTRLGAINTLNQPDRATCQEFTDLFIALARAKGIPARRMTGYAFTENSALRPLSLVQDILHSWPEYYDSDKARWVPVDPTWENTTGGVNYFDQFDLNHIVFAINGTSSTTPFPAGAYKLSDQISKDVEVTFSETAPVVSPQIAARLETKKWLGIPIPGWYQLVVSNTSGQAWYDIRIETGVSESNPELWTTAQRIGSLLPFQTQHIDLAVVHRGQLIPSMYPLKLSIALANGQELVKTDEIYVITVPTIAQVLDEPAFLTGLGVGSFAIIAIGTGCLLVYRRGR